MSGVVSRRRYGVPMVDHRDLFNNVCQSVERAGFEIAAPGQAGVHVGHRPQGVTVAWRQGPGPAPLPARLRIGTRGGDTPDPQSLRLVLTSALAVRLERAGHTVSHQHGDLLVTAPAHAAVL